MKISERVDEGVLYAEKCLHGSKRNDPKLQIKKSAAVEYTLINSILLNWINKWTKVSV